MVMQYTCKLCNLSDLVFSVWTEGQKKRGEALDDVRNHIRSFHETEPTNQHIQRRRD